MSREEVVQATRAFLLREVLRDPSASLGVDAPLVSGGLLTSFDLVLLTRFLEERFRVRVPDALVSREHLDTLALIARLVDSLGGGSEVPSRSPAAPATALDLLGPLLPSFQRAPLPVALASVGLAAALLASQGYTLQSPLDGLSLRFPVVRRDAEVFLKPVQAGAERPEDLEAGAGVPVPITRRRLRPVGNEPGRYPNPELGWLAPPGAVLFDRPAADNPLDRTRPWRQVANNYGFADEDFTPAKPAGEFRIGFFGASTLQNGSSNDRTLSAVVQRLLRTEHGRSQVRCLNFANVSWVITQELAAYVQIGVDFDLDLVVLYDGGTDLPARWLYDPRPGYRFEAFAHELWAPDQEARARALEELRRRSGYGTEVWRRELVEAYLGTVRRMRRVLPAGRPLIVVPQPTSTHGRYASLSAYPGHEPYLRHVLSCYDLLFTRLAEVTQQETLLEVVDLRSLAPAIHFWDDVHYDDRGTETIAGTLAVRLTRWIPPPR